MTLTVADQARITVQPQSLNPLVGANASFSVSAMGFPPPGYQWRFNQTNLVDNGRISGANGTNLTMTGLVTTDSGSYDVVVTNAYSAVTSQVATLGVYYPVGISVPPQDTVAIVGSNAVLERHGDRERAFELPVADAAGRTSWTAGGLAARRATC